MSEQSTATAYLDWGLDVMCPKCEEAIDLVKIDPVKRVEHWWRISIDSIKPSEIKE